MKIKSSFLNLYKTVLDRVSFDVRLFHKEYEKALSFLNRRERQELNSWIQQNYRHIIQDES